MRRSLSTVVLGLLLGASLVMPALAAEDSDVGFEAQPRDVLEPQIRSGSEFELSSIGVDGDRITTYFDAQKGELQLDFMPDDTSVEVQLELTFEGLVEFLDETGDGFDQGEEVQVLKIEEMAYDAPMVESTTGGYNISVSYSLPESDSTISFVFWAFENVTEHQGTDVNPTEVKFDVTLSSFPFMEEGSKVALMVKLRTELEPRLNLSESQVELEAAGEEYQGFFKWSRMASVDGQPEPVVGSVIENETQIGEQEVEFERTVLLAYERGEEIVHDPVVGVALAATPSDGSLDNDLPETGEVVKEMDLVVYLGMLGAGVLFVLLTVLARRRLG